MGVSIRVTYKWRVILDSLPFDNPASPRTCMLRGRRGGPERRREEILDLEVARVHLDLLAHAPWVAGAQ
jgi:hypothetical protein